MAKRKTYNPERRAWRGKSHKRAGKRVSDLKADTQLRVDIEAMSYEEWLAYYKAMPGGWLATAAPEEVLRQAYAERMLIHASDDE